uniref:Uncharacterized protein n=1 Tax=Rhizophora mucronata TaxID=61149 RepID=A0A2P2N9T6_RHIMU
MISAKHQTNQISITGPTKIFNHSVNKISANNRRSSSPIQCSPEYEA